MGQLRNLIINVPPRHMKSFLVSVFWPTWEWTFQPQLQYLCASYSDSLATRDAVRSRRLMNHPWYDSAFSPQWSFTSDQNMKTRYENDQGGHRIATSVGGLGTGEGGDRLVADDPHKVREAESPIMREAVTTWWDETMSTRGNDPKTVAKVIIMQRVHAEDLTGHLLQTGDYHHLCLPAEFEPRIHLLNPTSSSQLSSSPTQLPESESVDVSIRLDDPLWTLEHEEDLSGPSPDDWGDLDLDLDTALSDLIQSSADQEGGKGLAGPPVKAGPEITDREIQERAGLAVQRLRGALFARHNSNLILRPTNPAGGKGPKRRDPNPAPNAPERIGLLPKIPGISKFFTTTPNESNESEHPDDQAVQPAFSSEPEPHDDCEIYTDPRSEPGELLCPERFGPRELRELKRALATSFAIAGQLQQRPVPREGALFRSEWFQPLPVNLDPGDLQIIQMWDLAYSSKESADWTAALTAGVGPQGELYLLHAWRTRVEELKDWREDDLRGLAGALAHYIERLDPTPPLIGIWSGAFAKRLATQALCARVMKMLHARGLTVRIISVPEVTDKTLRAQLPAGRAEIGEVYADLQASWWPAFLAELLEFPRGAHDDWVDTLSGIAHLAVLLKGLAHREEGQSLTMGAYAKRNDPLSIGTGGMSQFKRELEARRRPTRRRR
jgi:predicted phage terminase large subunit-like protein